MRRLVALVAFVALCATPAFASKHPQAKIPTFYGSTYQVVGQQLTPEQTFQIAYNGNPCAIGLVCDSSGNLLVSIVSVSGASNTGVFNTVLPTLSNGQTASISLDQQGRILISPTSGAATLIQPSSVTYTVTTADTTCHFVAAGHVLAIQNEVTTAQPNAVTVFLNESSATCTASDPKYGIILGASQIVTPPTQGWAISTGTGFSYQQTTAGVTTILIISTTL
jgi:hypothetical protein